MIGLNIRKEYGQKSTRTSKYVEGTDIPNSKRDRKPIRMTLLYNTKWSKAIKSMVGIP
jgi:hypothetical protein